MRASRLVSLLLLLQTRGRMTAAELSEALEVSIRTVYRDVESLGAAGVPVYAERGPAGGYRLLDGYRTRLTGLTAGEAEALFLAGVPGPAAELGLGSVLTTAELKLRAALPSDLADRGGRIRQRFHLDAPSWFREPEPTPHLAALAGAVWEDRRIRVRYRRWQQPRDVTRVLDPLGVVLKAGRWYLVAAAAGQVRTYRVGAIGDLTVLDEPAERPAGFDLAACWQEHTERYERSVYRAEARVRMTVAALAQTVHLFPPAMSRAARAAAGAPDADGWLVTTVPIESIRHGHVEMLKLGAQVEVLAPTELRDRLAGTAHALAALYPPPGAAESSVADGALAQVDGDQAAGAAAKESDAEGGPGAAAGPPRAPVRR
ncbi:helix-turn-helix transcriptional regulator [Micromonospora cremea]|uniref:Predicted DNA-binding transcriptional regulator YafY, contains an HTH and WYL domains n=1 Tax=Micromonospora cremea TaxID=709881 RepID=A0A1N5VFT6_9ACTN|nr:WYL domain-containing protein [Micromonospora cremea]SIM71518.1 Predicted DNA-binding transcriptional regulator YafY, contains an HTH and WYL domains [Micromonospora cremea]